MDEEILDLAGMAVNWTGPGTEEEEGALDLASAPGSSSQYVSEPPNGSSVAPPAILANATVDPTDAAAGYFYQVEQLTFLWVLFILIVLGNATVLVALMFSKGRKSRMNFFIKNLAAADLSVGLISVLTDIIWKITISWEAGLVACKLIRFLQASVTYASTYVLVALSIDRYDAITHPMNFSGSWRRARGLVAVAWLLSFLFSAPILHFYETTETEDYGTQCWIDFDQTWKWRLYMTLISVTLFVIPAFLIGGCYIIIVVTIWSKGREMVPAAATAATSPQRLPTPAVEREKASLRSVTSACEVLLKSNKRRRKLKKKNGGGGGGDGEEEVETRRASSRGLIPKAKVKTVKMTFVIIFVFILCWSPYIIFDLLQVYGCIPDNNTNRAVATFIQSLAPLNSAANPLIYCLFSTNAGQNFCNLFGCGRGGRGGAGGRKGLSSGGTGRAGGGLGGGAARGASRGHPSAQNTKSTSLGFDSSSAATSTSRGSSSTAVGGGILKNSAYKTHSVASASGGGPGGRGRYSAVRTRDSSIVINNF